MSRDNPDRDAALAQLVAATVEEIDDFLHELNLGRRKMEQVFDAAGVYDTGSEEE